MNKTSSAPGRSPYHRVAVVTGAGSGIGKVAALALLQEGWDVALLGRRAEALQAVAELPVSADPTEGRGRALTVPCDVSDDQAVRVAFEQVVANFGRVDLLFNNAGTGNPPGDFTEWSAADWRRVIDVNLNGAFFCLQQAFRVMQRQNPQGGRIINNGSLSATTPRPNSSAYTSSKHAIKGLTKSANLDGRRYNICVGQLDIGNAHTDMAAAMSTGVTQADGRVAIEPMMDVACVARALVHMASMPLEANVLFQTVMASHMPFVGRG